MESRALHTRSPKSHSHKTNLEPKAPNFNPQTKESETEFVAFIEPLKGTLQGTLRVSLTEVTLKARAELLRRSGTPPDPGGEPGPARLWTSDFGGSENRRPLSRGLGFFLLFFNPSFPSAISSSGRPRMAEGGLGFRGLRFRVIREFPKNRGP